MGGWNLPMLARRMKKDVADVIPNGNECLAVSGVLNLYLAVPPRDCEAVHISLVGHCIEWPAWKREAVSVTQGETAEERSEKPWCIVP